MNDAELKAIAPLLDELAAKMADGLPRPIQNLLAKMPPAQQLAWLIENGDDHKPGMTPLVFPQPKPINPGPRKQRKGPSKGDLYKMETFHTELEKLHEALAEDLSGLYLDGNQNKPLHNPARMEAETRRIQAKYEVQVKALQDKAAELKTRAADLRTEAMSFDPLASLSSSVEMVKCNSLRPFVQEDVAELSFAELAARMNAMLNGDRVASGHEAMAVLYARYFGKRLADLEKSGGGALHGDGAKAVAAFQRLKAAIGGAAVSQKLEEAATLETQAGLCEGGASSLARHLATGRDPKSVTMKILKESF